MSPFPVVHFAGSKLISDEEHKEIRKRYLQEINPDPEIYCTLTFDVHDAGDRNHKHEWKRTKDADDYGIWECSCGARAGCDIGE